MNLLADAACICLCFVGYDLAFFSHGWNGADRSALKNDLLVLGLLLLRQAFVGDSSALWFWFFVTLKAT